MVKRIISFLIVVFPLFALAQAPDDSTKQMADTVSSISNSAPSDTAKIVSPDDAEEKFIPDSITVDTSKVKITDMGVAVAPSSMRFRVKPGKSETKYVTITNDTYYPHKFKMSFSDFGMSNNGVIRQKPIGQTNNEYGLTKWITASPNYVEVLPGEKKKIAIEVNLPDEDAAYKAAWCLLMIDQAREKDYILPPAAKDGNVAMGVIPTFGFGVYIYQNPPNVKINKVEIISFTFNYDKNNRFIHLRAKNVGDGIGFCKSYIEFNNLNTGYSERMPLKQFNVLPGQEREFEFQLPGNIPKGKYSIMGVLDFGSEEELEAAEMEITVE